MKGHVEQAAADFVVEMAQGPDHLQQSTSRLKRRVKGLYQVVSDLELPVASVLSLRLQCTSKVSGAAGQLLEQPAFEEAHGEQIRQQQALQSYSQAGMGLIVSTIERAQVEAMMLLNQTSEFSGLQALPVAVPLVSAEASKAASCSSSEMESHLLSDVASKHANTAESTIISLDESEVPVSIGGSLQRVRNVTVNLHALSAHTLSDMEQQDCQSKLKVQEELLADVIQSHQHLSVEHEQMRNHLNRDKDQMINQQETDLDSRNQAINQLQCAIACQAQADVEQKKMIAMQSQTIAALQAKLNKMQSVQQQTISGSPQRSCKECAADGQPPRACKKSVTDDDEWKDLQAEHWHCTAPHACQSAFRDHRRAAAHFLHFDV